MIINGEGREGEVHLALPLNESLFEKKPGG
jgi:hypothetical protein